MRKFSFGKIPAGDGHPCRVIAEIGGNFQTLDQGYRLIDAAIRAGADAVKLQTFKANTLASKAARYEMANTGNVSQWDLFREGELSNQDHREIYAYARGKGIEIFSTPSHKEDVELLESLGSTLFKIGSDDTSNLEFISEVASTGKPVMVATGMCTIREVDDIVNALCKTGNGDFAILHAVTVYPTPYSSVNLKVIKTYLDRFPGIAIGYSDHTIGPNCSFAARVLGACIIERHFTLDRHAPGPDHILSSDEAELKGLIDSIRIYEAAEGSGVKMPTGQEAINRRNNRKSIVMGKPISRNETISMEHLAIKRPGWGIDPVQVQNLVGKRVNRDLNQDDVLTWECIGD